MSNSRTEHGKIIVIEGLDGSGKATQSRLLAERLSKQFDVRQLSFPDYSSDSSALVKMYLGGELGGDPMCVNAYAAASFYAVDRVASYLRVWKDDYLSGKLIIFDRYTTSNAIYMMTKVAAGERDAFLAWLRDYEYNKLQLPEPDAVIYLDMSPEVSQKLMSQRYSGDETKKDLHEKNLGFLLRCRESALYSAKKLGWSIISCDDTKAPFSVEDISQTIFTEVCDRLSL